MFRYGSDESLLGLRFAVDAETDAYASCQRVKSTRPQCKAAPLRHERRRLGYFQR